MQDVALALSIQVGLFLITSILGYKIIMREKREVLAHVDSKITSTMDQALVSIDGKVQEAIDGVGEALNEVFARPVVKASMTQIGRQGGEAMQNKALINRMATDVLDGPKFAGLKMAAKMGLNIDIDQYIEENGAVATLQAAQSLGGLVGFDITKALSGGLNGANLAVGSESNGINYYLGR